MELTPGQRKAAFAVIVLALAGLGALLLVPKLVLHKGRARGSPAAVTQPLRSTPPASPPPAPSTGPGSAAPPAAGGADIYNWLPFSQAGLTAAANVAQRFATDYTTYSYTESAASFVRPMRGIVTQQLAVTLARGYATPGVARLRTKQKQVYAGTAHITALRAFGPQSITFLVAVAQKVTDTGGVSHTTVNYAITVIGAATRWQVNDVQLASAGNT